MGRPGTKSTCPHGYLGAGVKSILASLILALDPWQRTVLVKYHTYGQDPTNQNESLAYIPLIPPKILDPRTEIVL